MKKSLKLSVFFVLIPLFFEKVSSNSMCSVKKSGKFCTCKRVTDKTATTVVTEADCSRINLEGIPTPDQLTSDLNLLDLSHNKINQLDSRTEFSSQSLEILLLSYNNIVYIGDDFFNEIPNLRKVDLSHNSLKSLDTVGIFELSAKLVSLDLSFNHLEKIHQDVLAPLTQLQELDLSYNNASLGRNLVNTSNFLIESLKMNANITSLKLDNLDLNDLHNLYFSNFTNLKTLSLADNHFEEVPKVPYTVEYLDLSGSDIKVLQAKHLDYHSLKTLKLERMKKLESIHQYAFYNLQALEELSIRFCHNLKEFNELVFEILHKNLEFRIKKISLAGNGLQSLNSTYKYLFQNADSVDLSDNPWNCDCDLLWLQDVNNLVRSDNIRCSSPRSLASRKLMDLTDRNFPTCYSQKYGKKSHRIMISFLAFLVVLLSGLVGYLLYYHPTWYSNRSVGPNSPYNPTRENDDL